MEKNVAERICKLILKYCNDDVSDVHHIKYYCDRILIVYASRIPPRPIRGTKLGGCDLSIVEFLGSKSGASRQCASALVKPYGEMHSNIAHHFIEKEVTNQRQ